MKAVGKDKKHPKPDLYNDLHYIWDLFIALSSSRTELAAIKFSEIESILNLSGILNTERRQEVTHLIRIMDLKYLEFMREKHKADLKRKR